MKSKPKSRVSPQKATSSVVATTSSRRTRVVAIGNQKGGVGKTTVTVNLAAALAEAGARVLVWDLDMNCGATQTLGVELGAFAGTLEVLTGDDAMADVILKGGDAEAREAGVDLPERLDLVPAGRDLESVNERLAERRKFLDYRGLIRRPLDEVAGQYDFVLLDTAPNATAPTLAAYAAADYFVLTTVPEPLAVNALQQAIADIAEAQASVNPDLQLLGVVVGSLDERGKITRKINDFVTVAFAHGEAGGPGGTGGTAKFDTTISRSVVIPQAQAAKKSVIDHAPEHKVSEQFRELAAEVLERVAAAEGVEIEQEEAPLAKAA
jgi:chromosome partitioning protein